MIVAIRFYPVLQSLQSLQSFLVGLVVELRVSFPCWFGLQGF
jgi:hypothetical protein